MVELSSPYIIAYANISSMIVLQYILSVYFHIQLVIQLHLHCSIQNEEQLQQHESYPWIRQELKHRGSVKQKLMLYRFRFGTDRTIGQR